MRLMYPTMNIPGTLNWGRYSQFQWNFESRLMESQAHVLKPKLNTAKLTYIVSASAGTPPHLQFLKKCPTPLLNIENRRIDVWELSVPLDSPHLDSWASAFRANYCLDNEIDDLREGTGLSRSEYLTSLVFPDSSAAPGPAIRAGDFAELLIADYLEYLCGYWVPREKYAEKASRNESAKGVDILGFSMANESLPAAQDTMLVFEVKAQLSAGKYSGRLQHAIDDSAKDLLRRSFTLNATKRRLLRAGDKQKALLVQRFQNPSDTPYIYRSGAAAVLSDTTYDEPSLIASTTAGHNNKEALELIVIRGKDLMTLTHKLYQKAADEA
jgi:hypothetical protein